MHAIIPLKNYRCTCYVLITKTRISLTINQSINYRIAVGVLRNYYRFSIKKILFEKFITMNKVSKSTKSLLKQTQAQ